MRFEKDQNALALALALCPGPHWGAYSAPQIPYLDFLGMERIDKEKGGKGRGANREAWGGKEGGGKCVGSSL